MASVPSSAPALRVFEAVTLRQRTVGFIGRREISPDEAMLFKRCSSIHTMFMRVPIDVVFLDAQRRVVRSVRSVRPWRPYVGCSGAAHVMEMRAGEVERRGISTGDRL